ncbi:MAG: peptidase-C39 like family protein [Breznakibacter sp.]
MQLSRFLEILPQPDDVTCGPTSLHAVYNHFGASVGLNEVIDSVNFLEDGGTLAVMLGIDALKRGFEASIVTYNLKVFDLSWANLSGPDLIAKLQLQLQHKHGKKFGEASRAYIEFLSLGGKLLFEDLTVSLLDRYFSQNLPILTGLSATYLYQSRREFTNHRNQTVYDDMRGEPAGHFVVLCGMEEGTVFVSDPYPENPFGQSHYYQVEVRRLLNSVLLGIVTYDANLLIVSPNKTISNL